MTLSEDKNHIRCSETFTKEGIGGYGKELVIPLIDTYFVVLLAVEQICNKKISLNHKTFVKELHMTFKTLHAEKFIPYISSCLKETIRTAIMRCKEASFLEF